jgi:hypothetical protein
MFHLHSSLLQHCQTPHSSWELRRSSQVVAWRRTRSHPRPPGHDTTSICAELREPTDEKGLSVKHYCKKAASTGVSHRLHGDDAVSRLKSLHDSSSGTRSPSSALSQIAHISAACYHQRMSGTNIPCKFRYIFIQASWPSRPLKHCIRTTCQ